MQSMRTTFCFALLAVTALLHAAELRVSRAILPGGVIDDRRLLSEINLKSIELRDTKGAIKIADLLKQLDRKKCDIQLPKPGRQRLTAAETAQRYRKGVLVVSSL